MAQPTKRNLRAKKVDNSVVIINPPIKKPAAGDSNGSLDEWTNISREVLRERITEIANNPGKFLRMYECM